MNLRKLKKRISKKDRDELRSNYKANIRFFGVEKEDIIPYNKWILAIYTHKYDKSGIVPIKGY